MTSARPWFLRTIHCLPYCISQNVDISVHTFSSASICITWSQCQPLPKLQPSVLLPHTHRQSHLPCLIASLTGTSGAVAASLLHFVVVWPPEFPITRWWHNAFSFPLSELPWQLRNCLCQAPMGLCLPDSGKGPKKWYVRELRESSQDYDPEHVFLWPGITTPFPFYCCLTFLDTHPSSASHIMIRLPALNWLLIAF